MKRFFLTLIFITLFFCTFNVYAGVVNINNGEYELTCIYSDGAELTITRNDVYIINSSNSINSSANSGIKFYLTSEQMPEVDADGKLIRSHASELLENHGCPDKLYLYKVPQTKDDNVPEGQALESVDNYYYSTMSGIADKIAGSTTINHWYCLWFCSTTKINAEELDTNITLVSEEVNLTTSETALICDYQTIGSDALGSQTASLYIYSNKSFLEVGDRITTLKKSYNSKDGCPAELTAEEIKNNNPNGKYLAINDPTPRSVGNVLSGNYEYYSIRFVAIEGNKTTHDCTEENNGYPCAVYQYIGSRNGPPENGNQTDVCELLGNETIKTLKTIVSWLQVLVPALVVVLIAIDIVKMVLAGNLEEELPKKKKSIIIRLIIMIMFFFAPLIAGLIINLLNESGIVNIGDIECFFR